MGKVELSVFKGKDEGPRIRGTKARGLGDKVRAGWCAASDVAPKDIHVLVFTPLCNTLPLCMVWT